MRRTEFRLTVVVWSLTVTSVVFGAALVSGYQFPILVGLLGRGRDGVAEQLGKTYAFNTIGSISGAILGGFVFLPTWGAITTWRGVTFLLLSCALLLLGAGLGAYRRHASLLLRQIPGAAMVTLTVAAATVLVFSEGPSAVWRHAGVGTGRTEMPQGGKKRSQVMDG